MKIGDKKVLVNKQPYSYLAGVNIHKPKFILITITEQIENVPGEFSGKPQGPGFLAKGSDEYEYGYNYPSYGEGFNTTPWVRYASDEDFDKLSREEKDVMVDDYLWIDVTVYRCPALPTFYPGLLDWCEKHQELTYKGEECFYCKHMPEHEPKVLLNMEEHKWLGWYD